MGIKIFWDERAPAGIQAPVQRCISMILQMPAEVVIEGGLLLKGYDPGRRQYNAQQLLTCIDTIRTCAAIPDLMLLVIAGDLFLPGYEFVFGLARPNNGVAVISTARLGNGYYGRVENDDDLIDRIAKEGAHEIGHLLGLEHCTNPECCMFKPDTLDELDRKKKMLCADCRQQIAP